MHIWTVSFFFLFSFWVVSTFWALWVMLPGTFMYKFLHRLIFSFLFVINPEVELLGHVITMFTILSNGQIAFNSCCTILYSHQQCVMVSILGTLVIVRNFDSLVAQMVKCLPEMRRPGFNPWVRKIPWRRKWQPTPVLLPRKFHRWRSLVGYSPWGRKESDTTEWLHSVAMAVPCHGFHLHFPNDWGCWASFHVFIDHSYSTLEKCLIKPYRRYFF